MSLVLASTSRYRRELLARLNIPFEVLRPEVDETPLFNEAPLAQAKRLAEAKAVWVGERLRREAWVIGSDQVAELDGQALGKPGSFERAADQLAACSARRVQFHTAVTLYRRGDRETIRFCDLTVVQFRPLSNGEIERYLHAEQPYDCAGSFRAEGLGIALFEAIKASDPTGLIGLPLIELSRALRRVGYVVP